MDMAERNAAPAIIYNVKTRRSMMPQRADRTWATCQYETSLEIRIEYFSWSVGQRCRSGWIALHSGLILSAGLVGRRKRGTGRNRTTRHGKNETRSSRLPEAEPVRLYSDGSYICPGRQHSLLFREVIMVTACHPNKWWD